METGDGCIELVFDNLLLGLALTAAALLFVVVLIPLAVALVDVVILLLLALLGVAARVLFRRPWVVEATTVPLDPACGSLRWQVVGWRASAERCRQVPQSLAIGITPPDAELTGARYLPDARAAAEPGDQP